MTFLTQHFTRAELACRHCGRMELPLDFIDRLERVRVKVGFPMPISSGYRCPEHNSIVSNTGPSGPHTKRAVDVVLNGQQALTLITVALREGFTGIGVQQKGDARFIHLDDLPNAPGQPRPHVWSY